MSKVAQRNKITVMNFILSMMVLYIHSTNYDVYTLGTSGLGNVLLQAERFLWEVWKIAVPFFFCISGYLFFKNFRISDWPDKIKRRVKSLLLPFLIWSVLGYVFYLLLMKIPQITSRMNSSVDLGLTGFLKDIFIICGPNSPMWYLRNLMVYGIVFPPLFLLLKKMPKIPRIIIMVCLLVLFDYLSKWKIFEGTVYFAAGMFLGGFLPEEPWKTNKSRKTIGAGAFVVFIAMCFMSNLPTYMITVRNIVGIYGLWYSWDILFDPARERVIPWWMKISFFVYCSHYILLESMEKVFFMVGGDRVIFALADYVLSPVVIFVFLCLVAKIMKKICPKVWVVMTGGRG